MLIQTRKWTILFLAMVTVAALPLAARAQSLASGGAIEGIVTDESGAVLPGVTVTVRNVATGVIREAQTNAVGVFRAPLLPVGTYEVTAALSGFATQRRPSLLLTVGAVLNVDLTLKVRAAEEVVTVTAEAPIVETSRTQQSSTVGARAVANLPVNGRNFIDFVLTTPGVTRDTRLGDISFAGQRGTLNSLIIDGADNNNTFFGQALGRTGSGRAPYQFSQDAVQEFQVNRNAYSAEYGRAGGAVINVVTKSGSNEFHGSAFEFFRDKSLNANSYPNLTASPQRAKSAFRINQFGASLGGPIVKDRAFFFVSYDGQRRAIPNPVVIPTIVVPPDPDSQAGYATIQSKAGNYDLTRDQDVFLAKVDWQVDPKHRLSIRYNHQNFTGGNNENSGVTNALEHTGPALVQTRTVTGSLSSVFSSNFYNEFRFQYARDKEPGQANSADPETVVRQGGVLLLTFGRNNFSPRETTIDRLQFANVATWTRGAHSFKGGFDFNRDNIFNFFPGFFSGGYTFLSLGSFNRGFPNSAGESYQQNFAGVGTTGPETHPDFWELALFAQDDWRASKNLVVSIGVRYDIQKFNQPPVRNPDPQLAAAGIDTSFLNTDGNNIAPRVGFAWTASEKTVVRGGYGLFYGRTPSIMVGTAHSNNGINVIPVTFTGAVVPKWPNNFSSLPAGGTLARPSIFFFEPDYQQPEIHQASLGVDQAIGKDLAIAVSYLFVAGRNLQRTRDFNIGTPVATPIPIQGGGSVTIQQFPTVRPFTSFNRILRFESSADSTYNGFTVEIRKRFAGKLQASPGYTLGKVEDTKPDATAVVPGNASDDAKYASNPADFEADRASGDIDQRHRLVFSGIWDIDYVEGSGVKKALLGGWQFGWITTAETGLPYASKIVNDVNRDGNPSNDIVPGSRNSNRLPSIYYTDLRLTKRIPLGSRVKLDLIAEGFNILNHTNITGQIVNLYNFNATLAVLVPQLSLANPRNNFGSDSTTNIAGDSSERRFQLAAKFSF